MAQQRVRILRRQRIFNRAVWRKSSRFTLSGLIIIGIGVVLVSLGISSLNTGIMLNPGGTYLLIGFGAIIVLIGIIRLLIGFINPATPEDLQPIIDAENAEPAPSDIIQAEEEIIAAEEAGEDHV
jgi:hypothetical protein